MTPEESEAAQVIENALTPLDSQARQRALRWAWRRFVQEDVPDELAYESKFSSSI